MAVRRRLLEAGSQRTLCWREMDSNSVPGGERQGRPDCCLENGSGSDGGPEVRIHLPPGKSPVRTRLSRSRFRRRPEPKARNAFSCASINPDPEAAAEGQRDEKRGGATGGAQTRGELTMTSRVPLVSLEHARGEAMGLPARR